MVGIGGRLRRGMLWAAAVALAGAGTALHTGERLFDGGEPPRMAVLDPLLTSRMQSLTERSPSWRAGLDSLRASGLALTVATPEQARAHVETMAGYEPLHLGEVLPVRDGEGAVVGVVVTVDLPRLRQMARDARLSERELEADVDRILVHEIYGHVVPFSRTRRIADGCPDPGPNEPAASSCAIVRENRVRAELGMSLRDRYDLTALAVGRATANASGPARPL